MAGVRLPADNMRLPSLISLQMLECAARLGSFARAAAELNVTESAMSRQIQALEERLGVRFFDRIKKRVVLTAEGERYVREIRGELKAIERATKNLASRSSGMDVIELAAVPTFGTQWLIPRLASLREAHPRMLVNISARPGPFPFADSPFDAAIYHAERPWDGFPSQTLLAEGPSVLVCSPGLLLANHKLRKADDLLRYPLLHLATRPDAWPDWFSADDEELRQKARRGARYDLFSAVTRAAICGLGIAVLPEMMVHSEIASGQLVALPFPGASAAPPSGKYFVSYREQRPGDTRLTVFLDWLRSQCDEERGER